MTYFDKPEASGELAGGKDPQPMTLSAEEAAVARAMLSRLLDQAGEGEGAVATQRRASAVELARSVYLSRKRRVEHFGPVLFSEPAWDMLLVLYIYGDGGDQLSVTRLAEFSQSPLTTAIRWLDYLESQRLIERRQCPHDRRKFFVELSARGRKLLEEYFSGLLSTIVPTSRS